MKGEKKGEEREDTGGMEERREGGRKGETERMQKEMDGCWPCSHKLLLGPRLVLVQCSLVARLSLLPGNEAKYSGSSILCVPILINV